MGRIGIDWTAAAGKLLEGSYTLSAGISPSFVSLTTAPLVGVPWDQPTDVVFTDGGGTVRVRDCRIEDIQVQASESGFQWRVQLADHRWRWLYGCIEAEYNTGIPDGGRPEVGSQQDKEKKSARQLAEILLAAMGETGYDVSALPQDQYPEVKWDCVRPSQALADLCDRYQLAICFDPGSFRVTAAVRGRGAGLYQDSTSLSVDVRTSGLKIPERLIAVAERSEYEVSLELEPVGQDIDAATGRLSVKPIDDISYRPAAGWGNDVFAFAGVSETALTDPVTGKKITRQDLAEQTVYRWYRAKVAGVNLPDQAKQPATLRDILPLLGKLVDTLQYHDENGNKVVERKAAFVHGIFAADRQGTFDRVASNTVANTVYIGSFSLEEERGLVKFSEPVFRWGASNAIAAATIYLRCIVFGKRYQRARGVGGGHGDETVPVPGVVLQYKDGVAVNRGDVDRVLDEVLDYRQALYQATAAGSVVYAGTRDFKLDGMIQQVTWLCGPGGATTQVSASSEHDSAVPSQITRRFLEKQAASAKWVGLQEAGKGTGQITYPGDLPNLAKVTRWFQAYNPTGSEIPGYSLVRVTAVDATGIHSVAAPNADSQLGLFVTSASPIAAGGYGMISRDWPLPVKYAGSAPSYGDARGSASGSHELTTGKKGFIVTGVDAVNGLAKIVGVILIAASAGYVFGGYGSSNSCRGYEVDTWSTKTNLPAPSRQSFSATSIGTACYVTGGYSSGFLRDNDAYDAEADSWANKTDMPTPARVFHGHCAIGTKTYAFGGDGGGAPFADDDEYDPAGDSWANKTNMPAPTRTNLGAVGIGSAGYAVSGDNSSAVSIQDLDEYIPDSWASRSNGPSPGRGWHAVFGIGSALYAACGLSRPSYTTLQDCDQWSADSWVAKTSLPAPTRYECAGMAFDGKGYVTGGYGIRDNDEYDPGGDSWTSRADVPTAREQHASAGVTV